MNDHPFTVQPGSNMCVCGEPEAAHQDALYERVLAELISCYGEGDDTDWGYLTDLAMLIVSIVERERQVAA